MTCLQIRLIPSVVLIIKWYLIILQFNSMRAKHNKIKKIICKVPGCKWKKEIYLVKMRLHVGWHIMNDHLAKDSHRCGYCGLVGCTLSFKKSSGNGERKTIQNRIAAIIMNFLWKVVRNYHPLIHAQIDLLNVIIAKRFIGPIMETSVRQNAAGTSPDFC